MGSSSNHDEDEKGVISDADRRELKQRLDRLGDEIKAAEAKAERQQGAGEPDSRGSAIGMAFRLATELVVGVAVGGFIGWVLDRWLGTNPLLLIIFLLLGMAAGIYNAVRAAQEMQKQK